jgi:hypothetical protein
MRPPRGAGSDDIGRAFRLMAATVRPGKIAEVADQKFVARSGAKTPPARLLAGGPAGSEFILKPGEPARGTRG